jgi:hypothetical protein
MGKPKSKAEQNKNLSGSSETVSEIIRDNSIIGKLDTFFDRNLHIIFFISLILTVVIGIYLFDFKIDEGGDDSDYILSAKKFMEGRNFPTWHGAFYPIFLSLPMLIFGVNVVVFKIISLLCIIAHQVFFYLTFRNRISSTILSIILIIIAINANILYFASQTYSEAMYILLQAIVIYVFFGLIDRIKVNHWNYLNMYPRWLVLGLFMFLLAITRNIGLVIVPVIMLYFLLDRKYYAILYTLVSYSIFSLPFNLYQRIVWDINKSNMAQQLDGILLKNRYNVAAGTEDFSGMVTRFIENSKIYLSKHFMITIGLKDAASTATSIFPVLVIIAVFLVALYFAFRYSKIMMLIGIYLGAAVAGTFITLQQSWGQLRMIVIYVPLILLFCSWGIYQLSKAKGLRFMQLIILLLLVIILFKTSGFTAERIKQNKKVLAKNIAGNLYYGFTPDWVNFLRMSEWVGKNIPDSVKVASRKPSMSFIYSKGKEFYPIYRFPMENADTLIKRLRANHDHLCIISNSEFNKNKMPIPLQVNYRRISLAFIGQSNETYGIFEVMDSYKEAFYSTLNKFNINYYNDVESFLTKIRSNKTLYFGVSPDTLLNKLKKNNVEYVIMASLRVNPKMKTNRTINTIKRYLYYIELKYPGTFSLVHQIGKLEEEPAYLYGINYRLYGIK